MKTLKNFFTPLSVASNLGLDERQNDCKGFKAYYTLKYNAYPPHSMAGIEDFVFSPFRAFVIIFIPKPELLFLSKINAYNRTARIVFMPQERKGKS